MNNKIALVYDAIYPYTMGGGERRYYEIAKRLVNKGHEVHLYGMKLWKGADVIQKEGIYLHGICTSKPLYTKGGRRSIWQALYFGVNCLKLIREDFDVIDCCGFPYFSLFACKLVSLIKGKKLFSTWHEVWGKEYWKTYLGNLWIFGYEVERLSVKQPDKIIAVSNTTSKRIRDELGYTGPISIIPNGLDYGAIQAIEPSSTTSDIIYAGRLIDFKNIDVLVKAVGLIKKSLPNIKCLIIGDGPERTKLQALSHELNLETNIEFRGFLPKHEDVYSLMKSSKVFVLPSTREGFGIIVLEANACGLPVVTVDHPNNASKELINNRGNGYICKLNEKSVSNVITKVLTNNLSTSMKSMSLRAAKRFGWDSTAEAIMGVYT